MSVRYRVGARRGVGCSVPAGPRALLPPPARLIATLRRRLRLAAGVTCAPRPEGDGGPGESSRQDAAGAGTARAAGRRCPCRAGTGAGTGRGGAGAARTRPWGAERRGLSPAGPSPPGWVWVPGGWGGKRGAGAARDPLPVLPFCCGAVGSRPGPLVSPRQAPRHPSTCRAASPAKNTLRRQLVSVWVEPQSRCTGTAP